MGRTSFCRKTVFCGAAWRRCKILKIQPGNK
jgi:hypothetical protein